MRLAENLRSVLLVENILGVNRNWSFTEQNLCRKFLIPLCWVLSSVSINVAITYSNYPYDKSLGHSGVRVRTFMSTINTIIAIIWGWKTSRNFKKLLSLLSNVHMQMKRCPNYTLRTNRKLIIIILFYCLLIIGFLKRPRANNQWVDYNTINTINFLWIVLIYFSTIIRTGIEHLMFHCILDILSEQIQFIAIEVRAIGERLRNRPEVETTVPGSDAESSISKHQALMTLDGLCDAYIETFECCRLVNVIFSVPVSNTTA